MMNRKPHKVPEMLDFALGLLRDECYLGRSYEVFNLGPTNRLRAYGVALGFEMERTIEVVERINAIACEQREQGRNFASPYSLRFVRGCDALLAPQQGEGHKLMVELPSLVGARGADDLLRTLEARLMEEFAGRPHWGLDLDIIQGEAPMRRLYPDTYDRWLGVYRDLNTQGTFNNSFTDRIGISV